MRLFGTLFVNTVTICNQSCCSISSPSPHRHAQLCISPGVLLESILARVRFQNEGAQRGPSASPVLHQCPDQAKHHSPHVS